MGYERGGRLGGVLGRAVPDADFSDRPDGRMRAPQERRERARADQQQAARVLAGQERRSQRGGAGRAPLRQPLPVDQRARLARLAVEEE